MSNIQGTNPQWYQALTGHLSETQGNILYNPQWYQPLTGHLSETQGNIIISLYSLNLNY